MIPAADDWAVTWCSRCEASWETPYYSRPPIWMVLSLHFEWVCPAISPDVRRELNRTGVFL